MLKYIYKHINRMFAHRQKGKAMWPFKRTTFVPPKVSDPPVQAQVERSQTERDLVHFARTPGIWVWRDEPHSVLRVFLSGNRPLTRLNDGFDADDCMSYDEFRQFRLDLLKVTMPSATIDDLGGPDDWGTKLHQNYIAFHQNYDQSPSIFDDESLQSILGLLQGVLGWSEMPEVVQVSHRPKFGGNRWSPAS